MSDPTPKTTHTVEIDPAQARVITDEGWERLRMLFEGEPVCGIAWRENGLEVWTGDGNSALLIGDSSAYGPLFDAAEAVTG